MTNENAINILRHLSPPRTSKAAFDAFRQAIEMAIEALKKPCWIPCDMKLPNIGESVFVTFDTEEVCEMKLWEIAGVGQYWFNPYDGYTYDFDRIIAWCEKPKPYKREKE